MNVKGKKTTLKTNRRKPTLCKIYLFIYFLKCIEFLQLSSILTLKEMFENKEIPTNSKAQMAFNAGPRAPMRPRVLQAARDRCALCRERARRGGLLGGLGLGSKIGSHELLMRDATS